MKIQDRTYTASAYATKTNKAASQPQQVEVRFGAKAKLVLPTPEDALSKKELLQNLPSLPFQECFNSAFEVAVNRNYTEAKTMDFLLGLLEPLVYVSKHLSEFDENQNPMLAQIQEMQGKKTRKEDHDLYTSFLPKEAQFKKLKGEEIHKIFYKPYERWMQKNILPFEDKRGGGGGKNNLLDMLSGGGPSPAKVARLNKVDLEPALRQLLTGFINKYPDTTLERTGPRFFEFLQEAAKQPDAPQEIKQGAQFFAQLQNQIRVAIASGQALEKVESDSVEGFKERLHELYSEERPKTKNLMSEEQFIHTSKLIKRMERSNKMSPEFNTLIEQLHTLLYDLPWTGTEDKQISLDDVKKQLDDDHYGLDKVKEYILDHMAEVVHFQELKQAGKLDGDHKVPNIICLVGPPGVGKTSLGQSIAKAMGRKFIRKSLGGVNDEAEIRGHRSTYIGAKAGRIVEGMIKSGSNNPVFMLDEIDKLNSNIKGDPAAALLEVLDPEQNNNFQDNYLDVGIDLSKVFFIATANYEHQIPPALKDRMQVIRLDGYMPEEKVAIAQRHLVPRARKTLALSKEMVNADKEPLDLDGPTLNAMIEKYAPERGVRQLNNKIVQIAKALIRKRSSWKNTPPKITPDNLETWLGKPDFKPFKVDTTPKVGRVYGMFYSDGAKPGGSLPIYVKSDVRDVSDPDKARLRIESITGNFQDVMKNSLTEAYGFIRSHKKELSQKLEAYGVTEETFNNKAIDLFVSAKDQAIAKDGPSAGTAFAVALVSAITGIPVRGDTAITGEFDLEGNVNPIGGVREKVTGAYQEGVRNFIIPNANEADIATIPESVRENITIHTAKNLFEVIDLIMPKPEAAKQDSATAEAPRFSGAPKLQLVG